MNNPKPNLWLAPLVAVLVLQAAASFLLQLLPTLAPLLGAQLGWPAITVGYAAAISMSGALAFLMLGTGLISRMGPIRTVQAGLGIGIAGVGILSLPWIGGPMAAAVAIGLAYGASMPTSSEILMRYAPPRHRSAIFSIKQAGVPLGAALAGATLPPLALAFGFQVALIFVAAIVLAAIVVVQPLRGRIDAARTIAPPLRFPQVLIEPLASLRASPALTRVSLAGGFLAVNQACWNTFLVLFITSNLRADLAIAGFAFATMQIAAIVGRILMGIWADRIGSGKTVLALTALVSGLMTIALALLLPPDIPLIALLAFCALAGLAVTGWNGVLLAEIARLAPTGKVAMVSAGGMVSVSLGLIGGPLLFSGLVLLTGGFDMAFLAMSLFPLAAAIILFPKGNP